MHLQVSKARFSYHLHGSGTRSATDLGLVMLHTSGNTWPLYLRWSTAHSPLTHAQSSLIIFKRLRNGCRGLLRHLVRRGQWDSLNHSSKKLIGDWERTGDELARSFRSDEWNLLLLLWHSIKLISNGSICPGWYDGYCRHYCPFQTGVIYFPIKLGEMLGAVFARINSS